MSENKKLISRTYIYGERTENISIAVPGTKKEEILAKFYKILEEYHNPKVLALEPKSKTDKKGYEPSNILLDEIVVSDFGVKLKNAQEVSALPKGSKRIAPSLYSGGDKFYTNKIISNQLQILEWENRESAEEYLSNLK